MDISVNFRGNTDKLNEGIDILSKDLGFNIGTGEKEICVSECDIGFDVRSDGNKATISYHTPADFFRALALTINSFKKNIGCNLSQSPAFESCGIMLDVSRGAVIKPCRVKEIMRIIAKMGFNRLMLYTEDVYEMEKYPYFGYMRGRYTVYELKDLDTYSQKLGIEIIPCIQTLGHLAHPLRWSQFRPMQESEAVLFVGEDKTYELIDDMIKTMRECFKSKKIHIGMDEAHGVGLGKYLAKHGYHNRFEILSAHLKSVLEICKKYDFEPMMWSDMFFRLASKNNAYYDWDSVLPENIAELIPDGVSQVYWDYYNIEEDFYDYMITEHEKMNCPVIFAGGIWTWSTPSVNYKYTVKSTIPALSSCKRNGVKHIMATLWGDEGCECDFFQSLLGLQLWAEYNYNGDKWQESLDEMFKICTGYDANLFKLLDTNDFGIDAAMPKRADIDTVEGNIVNISMQILYQNPMLGLLDKNVEKTNAHEHYAKLLAELNNFDIPERLKEMFDCHKQLLKVLSVKSDIGIRIKKAYDEGDRAELKSLADIINELADDFKILHSLRLKLWYKHNKPFGYELVSSRLALAEAYCRIASERISGYLRGETEILDEFKQERLNYNGIERPFFIEYSTNKIMMP